MILYALLVWPGSSNPAPVVTDVPSWPHCGISIGLGT